MSEIEQQMAVVVALGVDKSLLEDLMSALRRRLEPDDEARLLPRVLKWFEARVAGVLENDADGDLYSSTQAFFGKMREEWGELARVRNVDILLYMESLRTYEAKFRSLEAEELPRLDLPSVKRRRAALLTKAGL